MNKELKKLLQQGLVWHASQRMEDYSNSDNASTLNTGYGLLDNQLANGGWPCPSLIELLTPGVGLGELRLILPCVAKDHERVWALIAPGYELNGTALMRSGVNLSRLFIVKTQTVKDTAWSIQQCLQAGVFVIAWLPTSLPLHCLKKIKVACLDGNAACFLFRPVDAINHHSVASLRLQLKADDLDNIQVKIIKQAGRASGEYFRLSLIMGLYCGVAVKTCELPVYESKHTAKTQQKVSTDTLKTGSFKGPSVN